jgi:hypothetical protein
MRGTQPEVGEFSRRGFLGAAAAGVAGAWALPALALGDQKKPGLDATVAAAVERGLQWLKKDQARDGHWEATGGNYKTAMTALAGMSFLMEGSTLRDGQYSEQIRNAVKWFTAPARQQPNGLLADRRDGSFDNYMHGHGYGTMFLACAYGEAVDGEEQRKLEKAVTKAVEFTCKAQTQRKHKKPEGKEVDIGGWGYQSASETRNFDEGSVTVSALQALRAARNAAIPVPMENIDRAVNYLEACTTSKGGIIYSYTNAGGVAVAGQERPPLTAAAICCGFSAGQYKSDLPKRWIKFCKDNIPVAKGRVPHDEYQNYYYAQFIYALGENRYGEMFPNEPKESWLTWRKYREVMFPYLIEQQQKDGAWQSGYMGNVFVSAINLAILQLEKEMLPIYQR